MSKIIKIQDEILVSKIHIIRCKKVMFDKDLAELYGIETKTLNQAVKRNLERFPIDFMFRLNGQEIKEWQHVILRSQFVTLKRGHHIKHLPYVFTELGVAMLSSVLNSERAVQMNIFIMRAFVKMREMLATHKDLAEKIGKLEKELKLQGKDISDITVAVAKLIDDNERAKRKLPSAIGFEV